MSLRTNRRLVAATAMLALGLTACATERIVSGEGPDVLVEAERPVQAPPLPPAPDGGAGGDSGGPDADGATQVEPHPEAQGSHPVAWDRVSFDREAGELTVYWTSGVEPCTVLDEVTVEFLEDEVQVTVFEGSPPEAATISCVAMAQLKKFTVALDEDPGERRFVDGAA